MGLFLNSRLMSLPLAALLASCSVIDVPVSTASGSGIARGSSIILASESLPTNELNQRVRNRVESELVRAGYLVTPDAQYILELAVAKRPLAIGILLPEGETPESEAGTWRSRPVDRDTFALCAPSIYRLMFVISRAKTREIVFKGSSDDDICDQISDEKLKSMVAISVARLRETSIPKQYQPR